MSKIITYIKQFVKSNNFAMRLISIVFKIKDSYINLINNIFGIKYIDIGSGKGMAEVGWSNIDIQENGELISDSTILGFQSNSIKFIYSSHFFEHIDDSVAKNILNEAYRILKKGGVFRVVVPNQQFFIDQYKKRNYSYLKERIRLENLNTWHVYNTDTFLQNNY